MRRYRGHVVTRHPVTGDYHVHRDGVELEDMRRDGEWGYAGMFDDIDRRMRADGERARQQAWEDETDRLFREGPSPRPSIEVRAGPLRQLDPCPRCDARVELAELEHGARVPLDVMPTPSGRWVVSASRIPSGRPVVRRAHDGDPLEDRREVHHATCAGRPALADAHGQLSLRLGRYVQIEKPPRRRRARRRRPHATITPPLQLTLWTPTQKNVSTSSGTERSARLS